MAAGQPFVARANRHILPADDTHAIAALQVLGGGLLESLIHVGGDPPIAEEVGNPVPEVAEGPIQIPHLRPIKARL